MAPHLATCWRTRCLALPPVCPHPCGATHSATARPQVCVLCCGRNKVAVCAALPPATSCICSTHNTQPTDDAHAAIVRTHLQPVFVPAASRRSSLGLRLQQPVWDNSSLAGSAAAEGGWSAISQTAELCAEAVLVKALPHVVPLFNSLMLLFLCCLCACTCLLCP